MSPRRSVLTLTFTLGVSLGLVESTADAALYWSPWVSEEGGNPPTICTGWNEGAVGFGCRGGYCDDVRLFCETLPFGATMDIPSDYWTSYFSEEHDDIAVWWSVGWYPYDNEQYEVCHNTGGSVGVVNGVRCSGSNCDCVSLECAQPVEHVGYDTLAVHATACAWTGWYSEEQGSIDFGWNRYITGVECQGRYCDNKRFYVCSLVDPTP